MTRLFRAELLKVRTVRTFLWLGLGQVALILIALISVSASNDPIRSGGDNRAVAGIAAISLVFALIGGIITMAGEATHGTITQTLLVTPVREHVLEVKVVVAALIGLVLAVVAEVLTLAIAVPGASLDFHGARLVLLGVLIGAPLAAALGVGLGAVYHGQGAAITSSLLWLLIGENLVRLVGERPAKYAPGHVFAGLVSGERHGSDLLGMTAAGFASVAWAAVFLAAGLLAFLGRDI